MKTIKSIYTGVLSILLMTITACSKSTDRPVKPVIPRLPIDTIIHPDTPLLSAWKIINIDSIDRVNNILQYKYYQHLANPDSLALEMHTQNQIGFTAYKKLVYVLSGGIWYQLPGATANCSYAVNVQQLPTTNAPVNTIKITRTSFGSDLFKQIRTVLIPIQKMYDGSLPNNLDYSNYFLVRRALGLPPY